MPHPLDVITYGEAMAMFVAAAPGLLAQATQFTKRIAGVDLNVAVGLARLGFRVGYVSRVGRDSFGDYVRETLTGEDFGMSAEGVDRILDFVAVRSTGHADALDHVAEAVTHQHRGDFLQPAEVTDGGEGVPHQRASTVSASPRRAAATVCRRTASRSPSNWNRRALA